MGTRTDLFSPARPPATTPSIIHTRPCSTDPNHTLHLPFRGPQPSTFPSKKPCTSHTASLKARRSRQTHHYTHRCHHFAHYQTLNPHQSLGKTHFTGLKAMFGNRAARSECGLLYLSLPAVQDGGLETLVCFYALLHLSSPPSPASLLGL